MKYTNKFIFLIGIILPLTSARRINFYRKDYTYFDTFNAFYKLHWDSNGDSWDSAFVTCVGEESTLFYPKYEGEWTLVKNLTSVLAEPPNTTDIFVGIRDMFDVGEFATVDGYSSSVKMMEQNGQPEENCVTMNINTGTYKVAPCNRFPYTPLPFVCKKYDSEYCPTIDPGYQYVKSLKKCYKINKRLKTWDEAVRICYMEGGALIVLQNAVEANIIRDMLETNAQYHAGTRRRLFEYYTVRGQNINDVYQLPYNEDRYPPKVPGDCGAIYTRDTIYTGTSDCSTELPFICEMELNKM